MPQLAAQVNNLTLREALIYSVHPAWGRMPQHEQRRYVFDSCEPSRACTAMSKLIYSMEGINQHFLSGFVFVDKRMFTQLFAQGAAAEPQTERDTTLIAIAVL